MVDYRFIGAKFKAARLEKGWTQEQLAVMCNVGVTHISHIDAGADVIRTEYQH